MNLLELTPNEVFPRLQESGQAGAQQTLLGENGQPIGAVIYVFGRLETPEILAAVDGVTDQWREEAAPEVPPEVPPTPRNAQVDLQLDQTPVPKTPEKGEVYQHITTGQKICVRGPKTALDVGGPAWEKIADTPHTDEDFSYLCHHEFCRCKQ